MKNLLILFAKAPSAPRVKTRLKSVLTQKERGRLQKAFILDTLSFTDALPVARALACSPTVKDPFFVQCKKKSSVLLVKQEGSDLGERMKNAFLWGFAQGFKKVILIGSDTPTLPPSLVAEALNRLKTVPVVLGPSIDGGYYLIGAKPPIPDLFRGMAWGEKTVLLETMKRLPLFHLLPFWYDVDRPEDLAFLKEHLFLLKRQKRFFAKETWERLKG